MRLPLSTSTTKWQRPLTQPVLTDRVGGGGASVSVTIGLPHPYAPPAPPRDEASAPWVGSGGPPWLPAALVHLVLEYVEVVCGGHGDDVVLGVPGGVEDLLVEVQTVHADFVLLALATCRHLAGLEDLHRLAVLPGRLQGQVPPLAAVEHPEEVVVGAGHHHAERPQGGESR